MVHSLLQFRHRDVLRLEAGFKFACFFEVSVFQYGQKIFNGGKTNRLDNLPLKHSVNVMTMDFGAHFSKGKKMSAVSIASALKARGQCRNIGADIQIGITPMIGQNDEPGEVFTPADARAVRKWAENQPWVCSLSFWASNRDAERPGKDKTGNESSGIRQSPWEFTKIFKSFTRGH